MTTESTESTVSCDVCLQNIIFSKLRDHINLHTSQLRNFSPEKFNALYAASCSETAITASYMRTHVSIKPIRLFGEITIIDFLYDYTCDYCDKSFKKAKIHSVISHTCVVTSKARKLYRDRLRKQERQKRATQVHNPDSNQVNPSGNTEPLTTTETTHPSSTNETPSNTERETELLKEGQPIEGGAFSHIDIDALDISTHLAPPWDNPSTHLWSLFGK
ncbi:Peptidase M20 domain-containing protein [Fusarium oxysporum f. sp. albedinis]|nr:Peptidase M20 domain-containing protein [Fusarium oxysporum f. sp. albedinis]